MKFQSEIIMELILAIPISKYDIDTANNPQWKASGHCKIISWQMMKEYDPEESICIKWNMTGISPKPSSLLYSLIRYLN